MTISLAPRGPLTKAILVSAMPRSPVNCMTTSSETLWASRRTDASGCSNFLLAMSRWSGLVRSYRRISISALSPRMASSPCRPAWAPTAAKSVHERRSASALLAGIVPVAATTLNRPEKVRSAPATEASCLPLPAVSTPATTVKSGMAMFSFLVPPPVTLRNTSVPWAPAGGGVTTIPGPGRTRDTSASVCATMRLSFMPSASILGEVEADVDAEHGLRVLGGQRRQRIRLADRAEGLLVVVRIARRLLDGQLADLAVAADLEHRHRLTSGLRARFPPLVDLALHAGQIIGEREVGDVERHGSGALGRAGRPAERGRRRLGTRSRSGRRCGAWRRAAGDRRQLLLAGARRRCGAGRERAIRQSPVGQAGAPVRKTGRPCW